MDTLLIQRTLSMAPSFSVGLYKQGLTVPANLTLKSTYF